VTEYGFCVEPVLGLVQLDLRGIAWVIVGGESEPGAHHMRSSERVTCAINAAGVLLFMKQMSRREPIPDDLLIREFPT
jgi:protein gp37